MADPQATTTVPALRSALSIDGFDGRGAQRLMEPLFRGAPPPSSEGSTPRAASALAYVFESGERLWMPLTLRRAELREHKGQVSLPGGRPETGETLWETAWREAREEIALAVDEPEPLGVLTPVYIPVTHTHLHVHVAFGPEPAELRPEPSEVARIEIVALDDLLEPGRRRQKVLQIRDRDVDVPYFDLAGLFVWGATAMALSELAERLREAP